MDTIELRSILAATDLTTASDEVLRAAGAVAAATGAALHVVHAFDLDLSPHPGRAAEAATFQGRIAEAESRLALQVTRTLPAGLAVETRAVVIYVAHRAILDRAADVGADLV
ncbi:MAG TPA: universal stress protein, partial [Longimicrobiaceae bacterium]|nr:universal stress protein [Longimicrobiaceae bacterium]